jgi:A/G-specific adenine glycosylase
MALASRRLPGAVDHVFTHFALTLTVFRAEAPAGDAGAGRHALGRGDALDGEALPGVMRKVWAHAQTSLNRDGFRAR